MNNLIYGITDKPKTIKEWVLYALQQLSAIFVATVLISSICNTPIDAGLVGAGFGTLIYLCITKFESPIFISNSGAFVSAVIGALAIGESGHNVTAVILGGLVVMVVYGIFSLILTSKKGVQFLNKLLPYTIVGPVMMVIGINLATFIPTYTQINGEYSLVATAVAFFTLLIASIVAHYGKGFITTIPFLIAVVCGWVLTCVLTLTKVTTFIDFSTFRNMPIFSVPDFGFFHFDWNELNVKTLVQVIILFVPLSLCGVCEHIADHKALSTIVGVDLTEKPGLNRTLMGDGVASFFGTIVGQLPNTTYGESVATTGFSKVASTRVIALAGIMTASLGFIRPFQVVLSSIHSCVFGGCAMILYGFIASSGLKLLINEKIDLNNQKNLIIVSSILTIGIGGVVVNFGWISLSATALSLIVGVVLNLILKDKVDNADKKE